jgi:predicted nucleic acid-binding protein
MTAVRFLDTNILLYSISDAPREQTKRDIAVALLERDDNALSVQVLQEFYGQATRPTQPKPLPHEIAVGFVQAWLRFPVREMTVPILIGALDIKAACRIGMPRSLPRRARSAAAKSCRRTCRTAARSTAS